MKSKQFAYLTAIVSSLLMAGSMNLQAAAPAKPAVTAPVTMTAEEIVKKAGDALFPEKFTAKLEMTQIKPGSPNSVSQLMLYKSGKDMVRADYLAPATQVGQRLLRKEGQMWMSMKDTKRTVKLSAKQSLGGSEFSNGDIMRLNLEDDYTPSILSEDKDQWVIELKAKDRTVSYDKILFTIQKKGMRSVKQEFFTLSGKMIKSLEFQDYKTYNGIERPSVFMMKSALAEGVYSKMNYLEFTPGKTLPDSEFRQESLSKQ